MAVIDLADAVACEIQNSRLGPSCMNPLNPKKLLMTNWTAIKPVAKQKHFLVSRMIQPDEPTDQIELLEIEAVFSKTTQTIAWRDLQDDGVWRKGWV
jgi:tryptophan-rich hypothetical protein